MKKLSKKNITVTLLCVVFILSAMLTGCAAVTGYSTLDSGFGAASGAVPAEASQASSYSVTIDVNPSIELKVADGLVTEGLAYNDDGANVLSEVTVAGLSVNDAVKAYVAALAEKGYLAASQTEPCVLFTVVSGNEEAVDVHELVKDTQETMEDLNIECEVKGAYASDETSQKAAALGLSAGRYIVMDNIAYKEGITVEEAAQKYSGYKMGQLIELIADDSGSGEDVEKEEDEDKDAKEDKGEKEGQVLKDLTKEQKEIVKPALETFKKEIKKAEKAFRKDVKNIKEDYKKQIKALRKEYKKGDKAAFAAKLEELKASALALREEKLKVLTDAIGAAKAKLIEAVSGTGIAPEILNGYLDMVAEREINTQYQYTALLNQFKVPGEFKNKDDKKDDGEDKKGVDEKDNENKNGERGGKHGDD